MQSTPQSTSFAPSYTTPSFTLCDPRTWPCFHFPQQTMFFPTPGPLHLPFFLPRVLFLSPFQIRNSYPYLCLDASAARRNLPSLTLRSGLKTPSHTALPFCSTHLPPHYLYSRWVVKTRRQTHISPKRNLVLPGSSQWRGGA